MAPKNVIIIGAGIGGLSTGCYAQMNGYHVRILEMNSVPGGLCTAWQRDGYTFDGCIHNLAGSAPDSLYHIMWQELGIVPQVKMYSYPELVRAERLDGEPLTVHTDLDHFEEHMRELAPLDAGVIRELIDAARQFSRHDLLSLAAGGWKNRLRALPMVPALLKYGRYTMGQFANRFSDPFLRRAFPNLIYDWPEQPMMVFLSFLGRSQAGDLAWPLGGSAHFARAIENRFLQLGGKIDYGARVLSVLTKDDRAIGVGLEDGSQERADIVVSNANGYATIIDMLGGRYTSQAIRAFYSAPDDRIEMGVHVSLGVARDLSAEPHAIILPLESPVEVSGELRDRFYVEAFGFDPSMAPAGKSVLKVVFATSYRYWLELHKNADRYLQEKAKIAETVINQLERRFAGLREQVEVIDVATPVTTERFTGNGHGYKTSWNRMLMAMLTGKRLSQTLPGLKQFYMVGQWAGLPGVPLVAAMGRDVARAICWSEGKAFVHYVGHQGPE